MATGTLSTVLADLAAPHLERALAIDEAVLGDVQPPHGLWLCDSQGPEQKPGPCC